MNKVTTYLIIILLGMAAVTGVALHQCQRLQQEKQRLSANVASLSAGTEQYKTEAGKNAARAQQLELTTGELRQQCADLQARLEDMGVRNKYLQRAVSASTSTTVLVDTIVRDSIVYVPQLAQLDTLQVLHWADAWVRLNGVIRGGRFTGSITSQDTLTVAVHRVPKKFWFIKWGTKRIDVSVASSNPHTEIKAVQCVEIKK